MKKVFAELKNHFIFAPQFTAIKVVSWMTKEKWQSGRMRQSWKLLTVTGPGVRIPLSPLVIKHIILYFCLKAYKTCDLIDLQVFFIGIRTTKIFKNAHNSVANSWQFWSQKKIATNRCLKHWLSTCKIL